MIVPSEEDLKDARRIVRHLLFNSLDLESLSIRGMERALGIPFSRLRRLLRWLQSEGVVVGYQVGTSMSFRVLDLERAVELGLIRLSGEDLERAVYSSMFLPVSIRGIIRDDLTLKFLPSSSELPGPYLAAIEALKRRWLLLYKAAVRTFGGEGGGGEGPSPDVEDEGEVRRMEEGLRLLGRELVAKVGMIPLLYLVTMRQLKVPVEVELDEEDIEEIVERLKAETGVSDGEIRLLRYFPSLDPIALFVRDVVMELGVPEEVTEEEFREAAARVAEKYLRLLIRFAGGRQPSRESRLMEVLTLRYAALFGVLMGAPMELVERCLRLADELEVERRVADARAG